MGDNLLHSHRKLMYYMNNPSHTMACQWLCFFFTNDLLFSSSATLSCAHTLEPCFQRNHSTLKPPASLLSHCPPIFLLAYTLNCSHFCFYPYSFLPALSLNSKNSLVRVPDSLAPLSLIKVTRNTLTLAESTNHCLHVLGRLGTAEENTENWQH